MNTRSASLRRGALYLSAGLLVILPTACGGGDASAAPRSTASVEGGTVTVVADAIAFDAGTIQAPAGEPFTIVLENAEAVVHNISVYGEEGGELIAEGEIITGPDATTELAVPALEAGEYFFVCDVHATEEAMTGTLVAGP